MKKELRVILSRSQLLQHYSVALIFLLFPLMDLFDRIRGNDGVHSLPFFWYIALILIASLVAFFKRKELAFQTYQINRTAKQFRDSVLATSIKMKWDLIELNDQVAKATTNDDSRGGISGLKVYIIRKDKSIEMNTRLLLSGGLLGLDVSRDSRKTKLAFLKIYQNSDRVENIIERTKIQIRNDEIKSENDRIKLENESEWNLKNTFKRIISYTFSFAFIGIAYWILSYEIHFIGLLLGLIGCTYLALDLYIIIKKIKART